MASRHTWLATLTVLGLLGSPAAAEEAGRPVSDDAGGWTFSFAPYLWAAGLICGPPGSTAKRP